MAHRPALLLPLCLALACSSSGDDEPEGPDDEVMAAAGSYQVTSTYDATGALPGVVGDTLSTLSGLRDDPAGTFIEVLEAAGVSLDWIPGTLRDQFENWVNNYIADRLYMGVPVTEEIALWVEDISGMLTHFDIMTQLDLGYLDENGGTDANHTLVSVAFDLRGERQLVDTPDLIDQLTIARTVPVQVTFAGDGEGTIEIGDHAFHMPLGDFAVVGFNQAVGALFGASDLHALLSGMVNCAGLAEAVSSKCIGPVCVGHKTEIQNFCESGIDLVVDRIEQRIASIDFAELHHATGVGALRFEVKEDDVAPEDGTFDVIEAGEWQADVNIDGVIAPVGATFVGQRIE